jgi:DNA mismatch repair protein MutL
MTIRVLPPDVADKIAAGEVIERPASVVKELVENSIDAGATQIQIEIREGGQRLIRVADDGNGILAEEVPLAFARHATSKLSDASDLDRIETFGFRGEALASIAAVSQVTVLTRPRSEVMGHFLHIQGGRVLRQEGRGCPAGTIITVEHLFQNVPARLKFLRQPQTEAGHIYDVVSRCALAYPRIHFRLVSDGRQAFQAPGSGQLHDVILALYGLEMAEQMLPLTTPEAAGGNEAQPQFRISGCIGSPSLHRANRGYITLFVNRRWIQDTSLAYAVVQAYHTLLPIGRYPVAVVLLEIAPGDIDVNVHPTKREVKFREARAVFGAVQRAVRHTLVTRAPVPEAGHAPRTWPAPDWERRQGLVTVGRREEAGSQLAMALGREPPWRGTDIEAEQPLQPVGPVRLPLLRVIGQVGQTYIVAEGPQGMYLVDQHAAHERVLYEKMMAERRQHVVASQVLLEPLALELPAPLAAVLAEQMPMLNEIGFDLAPFGGNSTLLRAVPAILVVPDVRAAVVDILEMLRQGDDPLASRAEERLIATVCKRAAVKAGQVLSPDEMQQLVRQLEQAESPRTCPHGRPTVVHFTVEQLEKEFGRR